MSKRAGGFRRALIQKIHAAARTMRLDDDTYRALLERVTGKRSCTDMKVLELEQVTQELDRLQGNALARPAVPLKDAPIRVQDGSRAMLAKVEALLAEAGREWSYAHGIAKNMFKVQRVEWLTPTQLHKLVAALEIDKKRRAAKAAQQ